jgi:hypothetical protein
MASSLKFYTVTITNSIAGTTPSDGFVDNTKVEQYLANASLTLETTPSGLTYDLCKAKRRANVRYGEIVRQLELVQNVMIPPLSISAPAGDYKTEPTSFTFQIAAYDWMWQTKDEENAGAVLSSTACLKRCIARALIADLFIEIDVVDPTASVALYGGPTSPQSVPRGGPWINVASAFEVGSYAANIAAAEAVISVTMMQY